MLPSIINFKIKNNLAVGIDIRSRDFEAKKIVKLIENKKNKTDVSVVFFDCDTQKTNQSIRGKQKDSSPKLDLPIADIINKEREWLAPLKKISDYYLDTTEFTINLLRKK